MSPEKSEELESVQHERLICCDGSQSKPPTLSAACNHCHRRVRVFTTRSIVLFSEARLPDDLIEQLTLAIIATNPSKG